MPLLEIVAALLTPVIALITTYIAVQQYMNDRLRVKIDLFERRYKVYAGALDFVNEIVRGGAVPDEAIGRFNQSTREAFFLFDDSVEKYIDELRAKGLEWRKVSRLLHQRGRSDQEKLISTDAELLSWFSSQYDASRRVFKQFLRLS